MERWEGKLIWFVSFLLLLLTLPDIGLTWDEPFYMLYPMKYMEWFKNPQLSTIEKFFPSEVHPPVGKYITLSGILLFSPFFSPLTSARIPVIILSSFLVYFVFRSTTSLWGREAGWFTSLATLFFPRLFGHMHLASLDLPLTFFFFLSVYAFWRGLEERKWSIIFGVITGLAISTKASGFFIFPPLVLWSLIFREKRSGRNFIWAGILAPFLFFLLWPRMWVDTGTHLREFISRQIYRLHIPVYYLGRVYKDTPPPPHYPWVMLFLTLSPVTLFLAIGGIIRKWRDRTLSLFIIPPLFFLLMVSLPGVERYDGVRLFLPVFPFLGVLSGYFFKRIYSRRGRLSFLLLLPSFVSLILIHPYYLSYYNILGGGLKGAERLGMEMTYWGDTINRKVFDYLNLHSSPRSLISFYPAGALQTKFYSLLGYLKEGRRGVDTVAEGSEWVVIQRREGLFNEKVTRLLKSYSPVFEVRKSGVWLVRIYGVK